MGTLIVWLAYSLILLGIVIVSALIALVIYGAYVVIKEYEKKRRGEDQTKV